MQYIIILSGIALIIVLISAKLSPALALLITAVVTGLLLHMPISKVITTINTGIGSTMSSLIMVLALGGMFGKIMEDSGAAQKIVTVLTSSVSRKNIQWAVLLTGLITGIPLFYNAGFVILVPLVFIVARSTRLPLLYVGIPMIAALSITHGFLPPHPGPATLINAFSAGFGKTLLYGLLLAVPIAIIAGVLFARVVSKPVVVNHITASATPEIKTLPSAAKSFAVALLPVFIITIGTVFPKTTSPVWQTIAGLFQDATTALLLSLVAYHRFITEYPDEKGNGDGYGWCKRNCHDHPDYCRRRGIQTNISG